VRSVSTRLGRTARLFALALASLLALTLAASPAQWLQLRGDPQMTGRAAGTGRMGAAPHEVWSWDIAAWEAYLAVGADTAPGVLGLPEGAPVDPAYFHRHAAEWGVGPPTHELSGDGTLTPMPSTYRARVAKILTDVPGLQRFEMEDSFSDGGQAPKRGRLWAYDTGEPRLVWETDDFDDTWAPVVLVVDADADGQLDLAVATHYRILVFDGATGATTMQLQYHGYRNYGWFGSADIDDDPYPEFAVVADFSMHAEVIDNDGESLSLRWIRRIQPDPSQSTKVVRPPPTALVDLEGDGRFEVLYSIYDDAGDSQWHVVAVDALSGETAYDFPRHYLHGVRDLDDDGRPELMVSTTHGEAMAPYAPLLVWSLDAPGAQPRQRWAHPGGRFSARPLDSLPLSVATGAADGRRATVHGDADADGHADLFVAAPQTRLSFAADTGTRPEVLEAHSLSAGLLWSLTGPPGAALEAVAVRGPDGGQPETLIHLRGRGGPDAAVDATGEGARLLQWSRSTYTPAGTPVVADLDGDGAVEVVVQAGTEEVVCLRSPAPGQGPRLHWQVPGFGQTNNAPYHKGVVAADLDDDGTLEVLLARRANDGSASLVALAADGSLRWQHVFEGFDGRMPIWNFSGLSYWNTGRFTAPDRRDVFATLRRGKLGSEIGFLLNGQTGVEIWRSAGYSLPADGVGRSLGGHPSASGDLDHDGLDEIVVMWPDRLHVIDGGTGEALHVRQAYAYTTGLNPIFSSTTFVGYAYPSIIDLVGDATPELLWGHCGYLNGLLTAGGDRLWETPHRNGTEVQSLAGIGEADGDGILDLVASTVEGVQLLDPTTGTARHTLAGIGPASTDMVSGDLDGDGRDEFLFGRGAEIICVEWTGEGMDLAWSLPLPAGVGDPALADVDGDGHLDLVLCTADGYVRALGPEAPVGTAVEAEPAGTAMAFGLLPPHPNPFNHTVTVPLHLDRAGSVRLEVVSSIGQIVATLVDGDLPPGPHHLTWDGLDHQGLPVASGSYILLLRSGLRQSVRPVVLVK